MNEPGPRSRIGQKRSIHKWLTLVLQAILLVGAALALWQARWQLALSTLVIVALTVLPFAVGRRFEIVIPPEFEALAVVFIYASIFLGEVQGRVGFLPRALDRPIHRGQPEALPSGDRE